MKAPAGAPVPGEAPIRDAATVIIGRQGAEGAEVLMGQRGGSAAFMPNKFVFPGGAVDAGDGAVPLARPLPAACCARVERGATPGLGHALAAAAIRELWEETGLVMGRPGAWPQPPAPDWQGFAATGLCPDAAGLRFVFRAITPPGRPRRFDARFFLADASAIAGEADAFANASGELSHLQWIPLGKVRGFDLPFITEVVLAEVAGRLNGSTAPDAVPFFDNSGVNSIFRRIT